MAEAGINVEINQVTVVARVTHQLSSADNGDDHNRRLGYHTTCALCRRVLREAPPVTSLGKATVPSGFQTLELSALREHDPCGMLIAVHKQCSAAFHARCLTYYLQEGASGGSTPNCPGCTTAVSSSVTTTEGTDPHCPLRGDDLVIIDAAAVEQ